MSQTIEDVDIMELEISTILADKPHAVLLNLGTGQQGKSVFAHRQCELYWPDRDVVMVNMPPEAFDRLKWPNHYRSLTMPKKLHDIEERRLIRPSRDVLIVDDAIFSAAARRSQSSDNVQLQQFLTIISHWELPIIYTVQNTSLLDISSWQSQDQYWFHKFMDPTALVQEREDYQMRQSMANMMLHIYREEGYDRHPKSYTWCSTTGEMLSTDPVRWWTPKHSKPLMGVIPSS